MSEAVTYALDQHELEGARKGPTKLALLSKSRDLDTTIAVRLAGVTTAGYGVPSATGSPLTAVKRNSELLLSSSIAFSMS